MPQLIAAFFISWLLFSLPEVVYSGQNVPSSQHQIVLDLSSRNSFSPSQDQIELAQSMGINALSFSDPTQVDGISIEGFAIILQSDIIFPLRHELYSELDNFQEAILTKYRETDRLFPGQITAMELFSYPHELDEYFPALAQQLSSNVTSNLNIPLFFRSAYPTVSQLPGGFEFKLVRISTDMAENFAPHQYTYYMPGQSVRNSLIGLDHIFNSTNQLNSSVLFLPADWFFNMVEEHPELEIVISSYVNGNPVPIPLPVQESTPPKINWSVLFLFLLWISFVVHFRFQPVYAQNISRYFLNHPFYVIDIMEHRIRNALPGIIVLTQHALLTGLFFFVSAEILIRELGLNALSYHLPYLFIFQNELLSLFVIGILLALALQFISLFWIYLLNNKMKYVSQVLNLYSWPLHINLIIVTFLVVLNQRGSAEVWMFSLSIVFAVVWFLSFNIAAIDGARFLDRFKVLNIFLTVGIHTLLVSFLIWYLIYSPTLIEPLRLAISLP